MFSQSAQRLVLEPRGGRAVCGIAAQELCDRSGLPYLYFTAVKGASTTESTAQLLTGLTKSDLPNDHAPLPSTPPAGGWGDMLRLLAGTLPDRPCIDAYLITGGLPGILLRWPAGTSAEDYLRDESADPASPLFAVPEQSLASEFPNPDVARRVLEAVGGDARAFATIANAAGGRGGSVSSGTLSPLLRQLTDDKQILAADQPLSTGGGKPTLYRVADSNLRLYLAILRDVLNLTRRGRPDAGYALFQNRWSSWRGRAVEPLVRASLQQATVSGTFPWPDAQAVGGWWNRQFNPEIDLVGADRAPVASRIHFGGSLKWLGTPFDTHDLRSLQEGVRRVPGFDASHTGLIVVTRSGTELAADAVDVVWGPGDVVAAWQS